MNDLPTEHLTRYTSHHPQDAVLVRISGEAAIVKLVQCRDGRHLGVGLLGFRSRLCCWLTL